MILSDCIKLVSVFEPSWWIRMGFLDIGSLFDRSCLTQDIKNVTLRN